MSFQFFWKSECELTPSSVFISYQWDIQDDVKAMRDKLEKAGFSCWMDVGQMGGGDQLNAKIDEGIRNAQVGEYLIFTPIVLSDNWINI